MIVTDLIISSIIEWSMVESKGMKNKIWQKLIAFYTVHVRRTIENVAISPRNMYKTARQI